MNNMLTIVIDPRRLVDLPWMAGEIDAMVDYAKASPAIDPREPVLVAGDPEHLRSAERRAEGIEVDPTTWSEIVEAAASVGLTAGETTRLARCEAPQ